jgi:hypothetical protein
LGRYIDWIARLDADDELAHPNSLESLFNAGEKLDHFNSLHKDDTGGTAISRGGGAIKVISSIDSG